MKISTPRPDRQNRGIALIMVMIVIISLTIIAGTFAYSMRIETRLASHAQLEPDLEWMGRSGVELGRYVLGRQLTVVNEPYTALNQAWAGASWVTNEFMDGISLDSMKLGIGTISVKIVDMERKVNINIASQDVLERAFMMIGVDPSEQQVVIDSIFDWKDPDDDPRLSGNESDFYLAQDPPYYAKNGPLDDISELLLIAGVTDDLYRGPRAIAPSDPSPRARSPFGFGASFAANSEPVGMVDLFTTLGNPQINLNTASAAVLQLLPGIDEIIAQEIIRRRAGNDGAEGTEDDFPFQSAGELSGVPGMTPEFLNLIRSMVNISSSTFEITVEASAGSYSRRYRAVVYRQSEREIPLLYFSLE